jgi:hypothetical protein
VKGRRSPLAVASGLAPGFEVNCYGEAGGARVVVLDAPSRPGSVEIAIRTRGQNPQSIAVSVEDAGRLLQALCLACVDLGLADQIVRDILANEDRPLGTVTTH